MDCNEVEKKIYLLFFGLLAQEEKEEVEQHIRYCSQCENYYNTFLRVHEVLKGWRRIQPSPNLIHKTLAKVEEAKRDEKEGRKKRVLLLLDRYSFFLACLFTFLSLFSFFLAFYLGPNPQSLVVIGHTKFWKGGPASLELFVYNHLSKRPIEGAEIELTLENPRGKRTKIGSFTSSKTGIASCHFTIPASFPVGKGKIHLKVHSPLDEEEVELPIETKDPFYLEVFSDQWVIPPGNPFWLNLTCLEKPFLKPLPHIPLQITCIDPKGYTIGKWNLQTSSFGSAFLKIPIGLWAPLGKYTIQIQAQNKQKTLFFWVQPLKEQGTLPVKWQWKKNANFLSPGHQAAELELSGHSVFTKKYFFYCSSYSQNIEIVPSQGTFSEKEKKIIKIRWKKRIPFPKSTQSLFIHCQISDGKGRYRNLHLPFFSAPKDLQYGFKVDQNGFLNPHEFTILYHAFLPNGKQPSTLFALIEKRKIPLKSPWGRLRIKRKEFPKIPKIQFFWGKKKLYEISLPSSSQEEQERFWFPLFSKPVASKTTLKIPVYSSRKKGLVTLFLIQNNLLLSSTTLNIKKKKGQLWATGLGKLKVPPFLQGPATILAYLVTPSEYLGPLEKVQAYSPLIYSQPVYFLTSTKLARILTAKNQLNMISSPQFLSTKEVCLFSTPGQEEPSYWQAWRRSLSQGDASSLTSSLFREFALWKEMLGPDPEAYPLDSYQEKRENWLLQREAWISVAILLGLFAFYFSLWRYHNKGKTFKITFFSFLLTFTFFFPTSPFGCSPTGPKGDDFFLPQRRALEWAFTIPSPQASQPRWFLPFRKIWKGKKLTIPLPAKYAIQELPSTRIGLKIRTYEGLEMEKELAIPKELLPLTEIEVSPIHPAENKIKIHFFYQGPINKGKQLYYAIYPYTGKFTPKNYPRKVLFHFTQMKKTASFQRSFSTNLPSGLKGLAKIVLFLDKRIIGEQPFFIPPFPSLKAKKLKRTQKPPSILPQYYLGWKEEELSFQSFGKLKGENLKFSFLPHLGSWVTKQIHPIFSSHRSFTPFPVEFLASSSFFLPQFVWYFLHPSLLNPYPLIEAKIPLYFFLLKNLFQVAKDLGKEKFLHLQNFWDLYFYFRYLYERRTQLSTLELARLHYLFSQMLEFQILMEKNILSGIPFTGLVISKKILFHLLQEIQKRQNMDGSWSYFSKQEGILKTNQVRLWETSQIALLLVMAGVQGAPLTKALGYLQLNIQPHTNLLTLAFVAQAFAMEGSFEKELEEIFELFLLKSQSQNRGIYWARDQASPSPNILITSMVSKALLSRSKYLIAGLKSYQFLLNHKGALAALGPEDNDLSWRRFWFFQSFSPLLQSSIDPKNYQIILLSGKENGKKEILWEQTLNSSKNSRFQIPWKPTLFLKIYSQGIWILKISRP
ncbi:MAG: hypothetical protein D6785_04060 [Planctomycetota bacterium]|nr:MAG: hypothetical protein D6785_04060 [Planctomycetota bacterium]